MANYVGDWNQFIHTCKMEHWVFWLQGKIKLTMLSKEYYTKGYQTDIDRIKDW